MGGVDSQRYKRTAEWFYQRVFGDEGIPARNRETEQSLPPLLRTARSLEKGISKGWQSREAVFVKQGKLLANYEDDYEYDREVVRYFPTYESLTDRELRGYFTWRTKLRRGEVQKTSATYAYLYIYELLNQIGVDTPQEGYDKLRWFRQTYGQLDPSICGYLEQWSVDYVIQNGLDPELLAASPQVIFDNHLEVLVRIKDHTPQQIMEAVLGLASRWLGRSKFYAEHKAAMGQVIPSVLQGVSDHYARGKHPMVEQFYGPLRNRPVRLLDSAVFYRSRSAQQIEYRVDPLCVYRWNGSFWTEERYEYAASCPKLEAILKTVDAVMRECLGYGRPIKTGSELQWLTKLIRAEAAAYLERQKAAEAKKLHIDYSQLDAIRRNAAVTREALLVEEERLEEPCAEEPVQEAAPVDTPLDPSEYRLLQALLYGGDLSWVRTSGLMLSVLIDGINEKLYDTFLDTVLEASEPPEVIEDYISDLKEMIKP